MEFLDKIEFVLREGLCNFADFLYRYSCTYTVFLFLSIFVFFIVFLVFLVRGDI